MRYLTDFVSYNLNCILNLEGAATSRWEKQRSCQTAKLLTFRGDCTNRSQKKLIIKH